MEAQTVGGLGHQGIERRIAGEAENIIDAVVLRPLHWPDATVINHGNGRSAVVWINDRGPFVHGRVIDLSPGGGTGVGRRRVSVSHTDRGKSCFEPIAQRLEWLKGRVAWSTKRAGAGIRQVIRPLKCRATLRSRSSTGLRPVLVSTIRILAKSPKLFRSHCRNGRIWIYGKPMRLFATNMTGG
jgi:hypothetical protein